MHAYGYVSQAHPAHVLGSIAIAMVLQFGMFAEQL
jgi:hypothetical protein